MLAIVIASIVFFAGGLASSTWGLVLCFQHITALDYAPAQLAMFIGLLAMLIGYYGFSLAANELCWESYTVVAVLGMVRAIMAVFGLVMGFGAIDAGLVTWLTVVNAILGLGVLPIFVSVFVFALSYGEINEVGC
jgi:hypothetical protein